MTGDAAPKRGAGWPHDLALGIRLAVGGGRTSWARLIMGTIGVGMAAAVLLVAASVGHIVSSQSTRSAGMDANSTAIPGVAPLDRAFGNTDYRGLNIQGLYVHGTGPTSPVPPGLPRVPDPGEVVLSPALARLLDSPAGALLRPRFPQRIIGEISQSGLQGPQDLTFYAGMTAGELEPAVPEQIYSFGDQPQNSLSNTALLTLLVIGMVVLLVPILIMVSISTRIASAARDRRLAALRLVGAGARQVRRIAAAESLAPAATGLVLGTAIYLAFRQIAPQVEVLGVSVFTSDVTVSWPLVALIVVVVPVLAVGSAMMALRRTVIEPLGVVRGGRPVRRRIWWRMALVVVGVGLLVGAERLRADSRLWVWMVALGASMLLVGVPVLLPYLLERAVSAMRGGAPSWQLAIRRLQLDSGTPARVVGGVAVVLAGAIALQTVVTATATRLAVPPELQGVGDPGSYYVVGEGQSAAQLAAAIQRTGVTRGVYPSTDVAVRTQAGQTSGAILIASCAAIQHLARPIACRDGDVFSEDTGRPSFAPGTRLAMINGPDASSGPPATYGQWTVPAHVQPLNTAARLEFGPVADLVVTPAAIAGVPLPPLSESWTLVRVDPHNADAIEYVRNAVAAHPLRTFVENLTPPAELSADQQTFVQIRTGLLIGSLFTLALAGVSLLVLALEQVRERRRPLAMLSASGVPRAVLARSLLWQIAVPVAVGVLAAIATGLALAVLVLRITSTRLLLDWPDVGIFSAAAVILVLLVTGATLPALRSATRLSALRTE